MFPISESELADLQASAEQSLFEICTIYSSSGAYQDSFGQEQHAWAVIEDVPCGLEVRQVEFQDERGGQVVVLSGDAVLRVRLDQTINVHDYVVVRGKAYQVDGMVDGLTVRRAALKISALPEGA